MPPDRRPTQRVLDLLINAAPSAFAPPVVAKRLKMDEEEARFIIVGLARDGFVVREVACYRAASEHDPEL